jgi:hypothetical protein
VNRRKPSLEHTRGGNHKDHTQQSVLMRPARERNHQRSGEPNPKPQQEKPFRLISADKRVQKKSVERK